MSRPYSNDLRERVVRAVESGRSRRGAAEVFEVSASSAIKWVQRWTVTGSVSPSKMGAPKRRKLDPYADWLLDLVKEEPDIRLIDIQARLQEQGLSVSIGALWNFLDLHDLSFKKNPARQRAGAR